MFNRSLGFVRVSRCEPRISVTMAWGCDAPAGEILMYLKRVGEPTEFAVYPPLEIRGDVLVFQFDELLFTQKQGRFEGRLVAGVDKLATVHLEYRDATRAVSAENVNV